MKSRPSKHPFDLTSGRLCLDFANTLGNRLSGQPQERLTGFAEFMTFGEQAGAFSASKAQKLRRDGRKSARVASEFFQRSVALRETIFRIFSAVAARQEARQTDVETLNTAVRRLNACSLVMPGDGKASWQWLDESSDEEQLIGKIVRSAVELLTSRDIERVKMCAADDCGWLFMDDSRSRNRRWCEMRTCGSRHKARVYYQRTRADDQPMSG
jgi:predicted RNA-binding Zn ribbon-like protein